MNDCKPLYFKMKFFKNIFRAVAFFFFKLAHNVKALAKKGLYSTSLNDSTKVKLINKSSITFVRPFFANILLAAVFRQPIT